MRTGSTAGHGSYGSELASNGKPFHSDGMAPARAYLLGSLPPYNPTGRAREEPARELEP